MDYLKILHENPDLADEFDSLFDFFLLDELSPRDDSEGRCTFSPVSYTHLEFPERELVKWAELYPYMDVQEMTWKRKKLLSLGLHSSR